jgi:exosortase C (VPDSG-CTERM-specific)
MAIFATALVVVFCVPLFQLAGLAWNEDLYSQALLMPVISGYLIWLTRHRLPKTVQSSRIGTIGFAALGALCLAGWAFFAFRGAALPLNDKLAWLISAFVSFTIAGVFHFLGAGVARVTAYPLGLLLFLIPFPTAVRHGLEVVLQHSSAEVAYWMIKIAQIPVLRDGVVFALPGITIQVAEECSGIRSSLVLFITGLIGGFLFLETSKYRFWFTILMIPLGILRNGFRVLTLSLLCVHVDPKMIHSFIHHRGGPIFFALSLIPFFALLLHWRKKELREPQNKQATIGSVEKR